MPDRVSFFLFLIIFMPPLDELVHASNLLFAGCGLVEVVVQPLSGGNGCVPCPWRGEHLKAVVATRNLEVVNRRGAIYKGGCLFVWWQRLQSG